MTLGLEKSLEIVCDSITCHICTCSTSDNFITCVSVQGLYLQNPVAYCHENEQADCSLIFFFTQPTTGLCPCIAELIL